MKITNWLLLISMAAMLAACGGNDNGTTSNQLPHINAISSSTPAQQPSDVDETASEAASAASADTAMAELDRYTLANRCFALKSVVNGKFIQHDANGRYQANAINEAHASNFYLKPAALGSYLLYAADQTLLAVQGNDPSGLSNGFTGFHLASITAPANQTGWKVNHGVIWTIKQDAKGFSLTSQEHDSQHRQHNLAVDVNSSALGIADVALDNNENQRFIFVPANRCHAFPEISTNSIGKTYKGNGVDQPVVGFADIHSHISATGFLGGDHVGRPFSPYGVTQALPSGNKEHGPDGHLDLIGNLYGGTPLAAHDTQGWPTFNDWPAWDRLTYENTYYRWIKRTWKAGLRLVVNNLVQNDALCSLNNVLHSVNPSDPNLFAKVKRALAGIKGLDSIPDGLLHGLINKALDGKLNGLLGESCDGMKTALRQADFMYRMQDYIDAQNGGPGKGWFRIVTSPQQARQVINAGKLAVVLGLEISNPFDCKVTLVGVAGVNLVNQPHCTRASIKADLERLYQLGVRQINLVHEFNNALGGNGIFNGNIINLGNFADTGQFWQTSHCPTTHYYYSPVVSGGVLSLDPLSYAGDNPLSQLLDTLLQGTLPIYSKDPDQCNNRGITDLGRFAVKAVMAHHMMIDVDHMSVKMKGQVIHMAMAQTPMYPLISSHGGHGGVTMEQARDIINSGGLINPIDVTAERYMANLKKLRAITPDDQLFAMSYTSDVNGMAAQPEPRGADTTKIQYPFTLFQGPDWGPKFAGIAPITFERSCIPAGQRCFDLNAEGVAQYGLYADWVESVRVAAASQAPAALNALYSSAEHYLQVWEATYHYTPQEGAQ